MPKWQQLALNDLLLCAALKKKCVNGLKYIQKWGVLMPYYGNVRQLSIIKIDLKKKIKIDVKNMCIIKLFENFCGYNLVAPTL